MRSLNLEGILDDTNGQKIRNINGRNYIVLVLIEFVGLSIKKLYCPVELDLLVDNIFELNLSEIEITVIKE